MLFNSLEFALFLPLVFLCYWFIFQRHYKWQNLFIVAVSYIFYAWWSLAPLGLIALTSLLSYLSGVLIARARELRAAPEGKALSILDQIGSPKTILIANVAINLSILGVFKYYNFFASSFAELFQSMGYEVGWVTLHLVLPVGVSFYTFQALSYSIDIYRGKMSPTRDPIAFFAFVSFFPQLVAGPIERATNLLPQFERARSFNYGQAVDGMRQILWGFFKKIVIADTCAIVANNIFANWQLASSTELFLGAFAFTIQIYGDFSGYSDIAIGASRLFGISLRQNFNFPYFSRDMGEFWRRWHISLSTWFRDYVYIPLGGSRGTKLMVLRNTFVIFGLSGLWHGANWTFVVWGLYHACLFIPLMLIGKNRSHTNTAAEGKLLPNPIEIIQIAFTFLFAIIGWVIFRAETIGEAWGYIVGMFTSIDGSADYTHNIEDILYLSPFLVFLFIVEWLQREQQHGLQLTSSSRLAALLPWRFLRYSFYFGIVLCISLYINGKPATFIYFQF